MNNSRRVSAVFDLAEPGYHTLKVWMVDPAVVVQKLAVGRAAADLPGPQESFGR